LIVVVWVLLMRKMGGGAGGSGGPGGIFNVGNLKQLYLKKAAQK
jgi:cell division protease FtsH